jgi:sulfite exporter TauE/SafE
MTSLSQGFFLGIASGVSCITACAPLLLPYLVSECHSVRQNALRMVCFLVGRLSGYLLFAVFAWEAGRLISAESHSGFVFGLIYAVLACVLILYGFRSPSNLCAAKGIRGRLESFAFSRQAIFPALLGFLTGLSLCPPFIAALAGASSETSLYSSLLFFFSFFIATSLYVVPLPIAGLLGRYQAIRITGRLAAGLMGCYYLYRGLIMIHGGMHS